MAEVLFRAKLLRDESTTAWGFRLQGGTEYKKPLTLLKVVEESLADQAGLHAGDILVKLGGRVAEGMTHKEAQQAIITAGNSLEIIVERLDATTPSTPKLPHVPDANCRDPTDAVTAETADPSDEHVGIHFNTGDLAVACLSPVNVSLASTLEPQVVTVFPLKENGEDSDQETTLPRTAESSGCFIMPETDELEDKRPLDRRKLVQSSEGWPSSRPDDEDFAQNNKTQAKPEDIPANALQVSYNVTESCEEDEHSIPLLLQSSNGICCDMQIPSECDNPSSNSESEETDGEDLSNKPPLFHHIEGNNTTPFQTISHPSRTSNTSSSTDSALQQVNCDSTSKPIHYDYSTDCNIVNDPVSLVEYKNKDGTLNEVCNSTESDVFASNHIGNDEVSDESHSKNDTLDAIQFVKRSTIQGHEEPPDTGGTETNSTVLNTSLPATLSRSSNPDIVVRETLLCVGPDACSLYSSDSEYSSDSSIASVIYQSEPNPSRPVAPSNAPWRKRSSSGSSLAASPPAVTPRIDTNENIAISVARTVIENKFMCAQKDANENIVVSVKADMKPEAREESVYFANIHTTHSDTTEELPIPSSMNVEAGNVRTEEYEMLSCDALSASVTRPREPLVQKQALPSSSAPWRKPRPESRVNDHHLSAIPVESSHEGPVTVLNEEASESQADKECEDDSLSLQNDNNEVKCDPKDGKDQIDDDEADEKSDQDASSQKNEAKEVDKCTPITDTSSDKMFDQGDSKSKTSYPTENKGSSPKDNDDKKCTVLPKKSIINASSDQETLKPPFVLTHDITGRAIPSPMTLSTNKKTKDAPDDANSFHITNIIKVVDTGPQLIPSITLVANKIETKESYRPPKPALSLGETPGWGGPLYIDAGRTIDRRSMAVGSLPSLPGRSSPLPSGRGSPLTSGRGSPLASGRGSPLFFGSSPLAAAGTSPLLAHSGKTSPFMSSPPVSTHSTSSGIRFLNPTVNITPPTDDRLDALHPHFASHSDPLTKSEFVFTGASPDLADLPMPAVKEMVADLNRRLEVIAAQHPKIAQQPMPVPELGLCFVDSRGAARTKDISHDRAHHLTPHGHEILYEEQPYDQPHYEMHKHGRLPYSPTGSQRGSLSPVQSSSPLGGRRYSLPSGSLSPRGSPGRRVHFAEPVESSVIEIEPRKPRQKKRSMDPTSLSSMTTSVIPETVEYSSASSLAEKLDRIELENALASAAMRKTRAMLGSSSARQEAYSAPQGIKERHPKTDSRQERIIPIQNLPPSNADKLGLNDPRERRSVSPKGQISLTVQKGKSRNTEVSFTFPRTCAGPTSFTYTLTPGSTPDQPFSVSFNDPPSYEETINLSTNRAAPPDLSHLFPVKYPRHNSFDSTPLRTRSKPPVHPSGHFTGHVGDHNVHVGGERSAFGGSYVDSRATTRTTGPGVPGPVLEGPGILTGKAMTSLPTGWPDPSTDEGFYALFDKNFAQKFLHHIHWQSTSPEEQPPSETYKLVHEMDEERFHPSDDSQ